MKRSSKSRAIARPIISLLGIGVCIVLILVSAQFGFSRLLGRYGLLTMNIAAAAQAVRLASDDADAHRALATTFRNIQLKQEARRELEIAASLRPTDDYIWLELGNVRDELDDAEGALAAYDQAVARAPYYAHTRWQRANVRLRMGRYDEAFAELREAAKSNRIFLPTLIDLAWGLSHEDMRITEQLAGIDAVESRIAFARFLARKGKGTETLAQYKLSASNISAEQKRELVRSLMSAHSYPAAFLIWNGPEGNITSTPSRIYDGGFEGAIGFGEVGFGWNVSEDQSKVKVSLDNSEKESGDKSIRIAYDGDSPPGAPVFSQTILVKPQQKYRISFGVKTKKIVTGGAPVLSVTDARSTLVLAKSPGLQQDSSGWQKQTIEFTTPANCDAIVLSLVRNGCQTLPCPIFGVLWLDSFSIEEMK